MILQSSFCSFRHCAVSQKNECYNDYREKSDRLHELMTMQRNYQMAMPQPKRGRSHEQER